MSAAADVREVHPPPAPAATAPAGHAWERLESQLGWYSRAAERSQLTFRLVKIAQLVVAALIPVLATTDVDSVVLGSLGAAVVLLEGIEQLFQHQQNWLTYRSTAESLKHEKYLYLAEAGPYAHAERPDAMLAERVEGLVSQEHTRWAASMEDARSQAKPAAGR